MKFRPGVQNFTWQIHLRWQNGIDISQEVSFVGAKFRTKILIFCLWERNLEQIFLSPFVVITRGSQIAGWRPRQKKNTSLMAVGVERQR